MIQRRRPIPQRKVQTHRFPAALRYCPGVSLTRGLGPEGWRRTPPLWEDLDHEASSFVPPPLTLDLLAEKRAHRDQDRLHHRTAASRCRSRMQLRAAAHSKPSGRTELDSPTKLTDPCFYAQRRLKRRHGATPKPQATADKESGNRLAALHGGGRPPEPVLPIERARGGVPLKAIASI